MKTFIDLDSVDSILYPKVNIDEKAVQFIATDGTTTICNLYKLNQKPFVVIIEPRINQEIVSQINARVAAIDPDIDGQIVALNYSIDQGPKISVTFTPSKGIDITFPIELNTGGAHTILVSATDNKGSVVTTSAPFIYVKGQDVQVTLVPSAVEAGKPYNVNIVKGIPLSKWTVTHVSGPTQNPPAAGTLDSTGSMSFESPSLGLASGSYVWRFNFANSVTKDVNFRVYAKQIPILTLSEITIVSGQNISASMSNGVAGESWEISGTAGVTGNILIGAAGNGTIQLTPLNSGTIVASRGGQSIVQNIVVNAAGSALLTLSPNPINVGGTITATITKAIPGINYSINGALTGTIFIQANGSGATTFIATNSGNVVASFGTSVLNATLNVTNQNAASLTLTPNPVNEGAPLIVKVVNGIAGNTFTIGGTAGIGGNFVVGNDGTGSIVINATQDGTVTATSGSLILVQTLDVITSASAVLSIIPEIVTQGQEVTATVSGSINGYVYSLGGTSGVYAGKTITINGTSGGLVVKPVQSGTITATYNDQTLSRDITVNQAVYTPQLKVKRINDNMFVTNLSQIPINETLIFQLTGAKPNTVINNGTMNGNITNIVTFFKNIGGVWYWAYNQLSGNQPVGSINGITDADGNFTWRGVAQYTWPFNDSDDTNIPPVDMTFSLKLADNTDSNPIQIAWARQYLLKAINMTTNNSSSAEVQSTTFVDRYTQEINVNFGDNVMFLFQNMDSNGNIDIAIRLNNSFADTDFFPLMITSQNGNKGGPTPPFILDQAGSNFYYQRYTTLMDSGKVFYVKAKSGSHQTNSIVLRMNSFIGLTISKDWLNSNAAFITYNVNDKQYHHICNDQSEIPASWLPVKFAIRKTANGITKIGIVLIGGNVGDKVYTTWGVDFSGIKPITDSGATISMDANQVKSAAFFVTIAHNEYSSGQIAVLRAKAGNLISVVNVAVQFI